MMKANVTRKKLKVAIIGCGRMGLQHIRAIDQLDCAEVAALADPQADPATLSAVVSEHVPVYGDASDMLQKESPDVVHVVTPPATHAGLAREALGQGANVYVEKPFATCLADAEELVRLADRNGLRLCPGHQLLFEKTCDKMLQPLPKIGSIVHVESYFAFRTVRRSISPAEQLMDILPHPLYLLLHALQLQASQTAPGEVGVEALRVDPRGEIHGLLKVGNVVGHLIVTLKGRPVESYLRITATNGTVTGDFVRGVATSLPGPGASAAAVIARPFKESVQSAGKSALAFAERALSRQKSYPGLIRLLDAFYRSILTGGPAPISPESILQTTAIVESVKKDLDRQSRIREEDACSELAAREAQVAVLPKGSRRVLVTGGTGFMGQVLVRHLRQRGLAVRSLARTVPPCADRVAGVEYQQADLGDAVPEFSLQGVDVVVHCAAETAGDQKAHERNTIRATKHILEAAAKGGAKQFIHISSLAVLKPSRNNGGALREDSSVDFDNIGRGPYVWGKAEAERLVTQYAGQFGLASRIIRLGPLVNYEAFTAPGRLGRELDTLYVAVGTSRATLSVCEVHTAAEVIEYYIRAFDQAPPVLNLVEPEAPSRGELVARLQQERPDLRVVWLPLGIVRGLSALLKAMMYVALPGKKPLDVYAAFAAERYDTSLARLTIQGAADR